MKTIPVMAIIKETSQELSYFFKAAKGNRIVNDTGPCSH